MADNHSVRSKSSPSKTRGHGPFSIIDILEREIQKRPKGERRRFAVVLVRQLLRAAIAGDVLLLLQLVECVDGEPR